MIEYAPSSEVEMTQTSGRIGGRLNVGARTHVQDARRGIVHALRPLLRISFAVALMLMVCTAAQARPIAGRAQRLTYGTGQTAHPYIVYTPRGFTRHTRMPLLVMLHGCQTTAYDQMRASLYNPLANHHGFVVVYPDTDALENAQPGVLTRCWQWLNPVDLRRGQGDGAAVAAITRAVIKRWHIDRQRVYLTGISAGAFLTADIAAEYPDLYAAAGQNAGGAYDDATCLLGHVTPLTAAASAQLAFAEMGRRARVVPRLMIGGDADQAVPPGCADKALAQGLRTDNLVVSHHQTRPIKLTPASVRTAKARGGDSYTVSDYRDGHGCLVGQRYLVHGMGHFWSGGSSNPKWANFTDPKGPSAAVASWRFFSQFTLANTRWPCRPGSHAGDAHRHPGR